MQPTSTNRIVHNSNFNIFFTISSLCQRGFSLFFPKFFPYFKVCHGFWHSSSLKKTSSMNLKALLNMRTYKISQHIILHWASKTRKSTFSYTCSITTSDNIGATNSRRALSKTIHFYSFETKSKGKDTSEWRVNVRISSAPHAYRDNASANKK